MGHVSVGSAQLALLTDEPAPPHLLVLPVGAQSSCVDVKFRRNRAVLGAGLGAAVRISQPADTSRAASIADGGIFEPQQGPAAL